MKRYFLIISFVFLSFILSSCINKGETDSNKHNSDTNNSSNSKYEDKNIDKKDTRSELTIKDYYPILENSQYFYEGSGNEYASYNVLTDYVSENRIQLRSDNGGTEMVKVLEYEDCQLSVLMYRSGCYYRENLTKTAAESREIILKEPLIKGNTWVLPDNRKRYISNVEVKVITPLGNFKTLEVTTENEVGKTCEYYAPNIGLVKTTYTSDGLNVSSTLIEIKKNVPYTQTVRFYYPNLQNDKLYFVDKKLSFHTNDITKIMLEKSFKDLPQKDWGRVLGPNVKIKSLYLNKDNIVYADFTKELVREMNVSAVYESMILQSITNTLGTYYGVEKVYITIEGEPYGSDHIIKEKGETFTMDLKNSVELKSE